MEITASDREPVPCPSPVQVTQQAAYCGSSDLESEWDPGDSPGGRLAAQTLNTHTSIAQPSKNCRFSFDGFEGFEFAPIRTTSNTGVYTQTWKSAERHNESLVTRDSTPYPIVNPPEAETSARLALCDSGTTLPRGGTPPTSYQPQETASTEMSVGCAEPSESTQPFDKFKCNEPKRKDDELAAEQSQMQAGDSINSEDQPSVGISIADGQSCAASDQAPSSKASYAEDGPFDKQKHHDSLPHRRGDAHRIKKTHIAPSHQRIPLKGKSNTTGRPSEEDLLLLLMRLIRTRQNSETQASAEYARLADENVNLRKVNDAYEQRLAEATSQWHACTREQHVREAQLRELKDKYTRVKSLAQIVADDFNTIHDEHLEMNETIADLHAAKSQASESITQSLHQCQNGIVSLGVLREDLRQIRSELSRLISSEKEVAILQRQLNDTKSCYTTHAEEVANIVAAQASLRDSLNGRLDKIDIVSAQILACFQGWNGSELKDNIVTVLQNLNQPDQRDKELSQALGTGQAVLTTLLEHLCGVKNSVESMKVAQQDMSLGLSRKSETLLVAVREQRSQLGPCLELPNIIEKLSGRMVAAEDFAKVAQKGNAATNLVCTGLMTINRELIKKCSATETLNEVSALYEQLSQARETSDQVQRMFDSKNTEVDRLKSDLTCTQATIDDLHIQLKEQNDQHAEELKHVRDSHALSNAALAQRSDSALSTKDKFIQHLETQLKRLQEAVNTAVAKQHEYENKEQSLLTENACLQAQVAAQAMTIGKVEDAKSQLDAKVARLQNVEERLLEIQIRCEDRDNLAAEIANARKQTADIERELETAHRDATENRRRLSETTLSLSTAQAGLVELDSLRQEIIQRKAEIVKLADERDRLQASSDCTSDLKIQVEDYRQKLQSLQEAFNTAEANANRVPDLLVQLAALQEVENAVLKLKDDARSKEDQIVSFQSQVADLKVQLAELDDLKKESDLKDVELDRLGRRILSLENEARRYELIGSLLTNEELTALSESNVLALKAAIHRDRIGHDDKPDHTGIQNTEEYRVASEDDDEDLDRVPETQSQFLSVEGDEHSLPPNDFDLEFELLNVEHTHPGSNSDQKDASSTRTCASGDEMLLRPSKASQRSARPDTAGSSVQILVPATSQITSPMKTRNGSQIRHGTPDPNLGKGTLQVKFATPSQSQQEPYEPNSAKRRSADEGGASGTKRSRRVADLSKLATRPSTKSSSQAPSEGMSQAARNRSFTSSSAPLPSARRKPTNSKDKSRKSAMYESRFGDQA